MPIRTPNSAANPAMYNYLSKLAVEADFQRRGILKRMINVMAALARERGLTALTLGTRVELHENHMAFKALGFEQFGTASHPGYDRVTSLSFRKFL